MEQRDPEKVAALQRELAQNSKRLQQAQEIADTANQIYLRSRPKQGTVGNQPDEDEESDHEVGINYRPQNVNPSSVGRATHTNMGVVKKIEVPKFSGNILEYQDWKQTFQAMVESRTEDTATKLLYLKDCMKGELADLIKSVGHRTTAYHAAWAILETRFGGKKRLERIVYDCICNFKMVKTSKELADFDSGLRSAMARLMELDIVPPTYNMIASKLSETYLREYFNFLQKEKKEEDVESLQEFIEQKAKENAFVEETIKGASSVSSGARRPYAYAHHGSSQKEDKCAACGSPEHAIWRCTKFRGQNIHEKTQVIKKGGLCFKCLRSGHVADKCEMKMRNCGIDGCTRKHNKLLHSPEEPKEENERISQTNHATGRKMKYTLRVVPVLVFAHKEKTKVIKYALLDDGSDQSFVTERLANEMGLQGKRKRKKVSTLLQTEVMECREVDVTIQATTGNKTVFKLKRVDTVKRALRNITANWQIARQDYRHLQGIPFPEVDPEADIDLLIGADHPELMRSLREVSGEPGEPIARLMRAAHFHDVKHDI